MIRIAVVDDEPLARSGLIARLRGRADMDVVAEYADGESVAAALEQAPVDLVFLDVQMPGMSGLQVLRALPAQRRPLAVLLTAHERFAVHAFELNVVDYLLKPLDPDRLDEALERVRARLNSGSTAGVPAREAPYAARFQVRLGRRTVFVQAEQVEWFQADGDYVTLHVGTRMFLLRESLQNLHARLDPQRYVRVHRSAIVRVDHIAELQMLSNRDAMLRLRDGTPLRASRTYADALMARLRS